MAKNASILEGLIARLVEAKDGNGWFVDGRISNAERQELLRLIEDRPVEADTPTPNEQAALPAIKINESLVSSKKPKSQAILCVDFGTAASKAALSIPGYDVPSELGLGVTAGEPAMKPWVSSSIGVDASGRIVFGPQAEQGRVRISSIKSKLWDATHEIEKELLNIGGFGFTGVDCLIAYLGYLTQLIGEELETFDQPRHLPRRYAMPFAEDPSRKGLRERFAVWLGQAQLLADTFGDRLLQGLEPAELRSALDAVASMRAPAWFIRSDPACIGEPVAAGAFALSQDVADLSLYMIIDIGAGTSDFCILAVKKRTDGDVNVYRAEGSDYSVQVAGDAVDKAFQDFVRDELGIGLSPSEAADLERNRRAWKEALFENGQLEESVGEDQVPLSLELESFLQSDHWQTVQDALVEAQRACLRSTDRYWLSKWGVGPIRVVLTGGGAKLPLTEVLAQGRATGEGAEFIRIFREALPDYYLGSFEEPDDVPRLMVALGGSTPNPPMEFDRTGKRSDPTPPWRWGAGVQSKNETDLEGR